MRDDIVGVGLLQIDRRRSQRDAADAADNEHSYEADREVERRLEADRAAVESGDPIEDFDAGRHADQEAACREDPVDQRAKASSKHMMRPDSEAQETDRNT